MTLQSKRRYVHPQSGDTWMSIASRELPDQPVEEVAQMLQSWNLHVFMRPSTTKGGDTAGQPILPSDIIFIEPPNR